MRIAAIQFHPWFGERDANLDALRRRLPSGVDLAVFPELSVSGYRFRSRQQLARLAEPLDGPTLAAWRAWARELGCVIVGGFAERDGERLYNSAALVRPNGATTVYRKVHLFDAETELFDVGYEPWPVVDLGWARVGLMICFDWRFPEAARSLALRGAEIVAHPSNLVQPHCPEAMVTRALENRVFTVTANRVGVEDGEGGALRFIGRSRIVAPSGAVLAQAGETEETVLTADVDPAEARDKRIAPLSDLWADRRPELYGALAEAPERPWRDNVGVVVFDAAGRVLCGERRDRPGVWQLPQGGVEPGEEEQAAALRELREEVGAAEVDILARLDGFAYEFPPWLRHRPIARQWRGQRQTFFVARARPGFAPDPAAAESDEFVRLDWRFPADLTAGMADFKRPVYERLFREIAERKLDGLA